MRIVVALLMAVSVVAYAPTVYTHPTKDEQEFYVDSAYCESISQVYVPTSYGMMPTVNRRRYDACMRGRGWRPESS